MINIINKVALPIALLGAINYGLIGLFRIDMLYYLSGSALQQAALVVIGVSGALVALSLLMKR